MSLSNVINSLINSDSSLYKSLAILFAFAVGPVAAFFWIAENGSVAKFVSVLLFLFIVSVEFVVCIALAALDKEKSDYTQKSAELSEREDAVKKQETELQSFQELNPRWLALIKHLDSAGIGVNGKGVPGVLAGKEVTLPPFRPEV